MSGSPSRAADPDRADGAVESPAADDCRLLLRKCVPVPCVPVSCEPPLGRAVGADARDRTSDAYSAPGELNCARPVALRFQRSSTTPSCVESPAYPMTPTDAGIQRGKNRAEDSETRYSRTECPIPGCPG